MAIILSLSFLNLEKEIIVLFLMMVGVFLINSLYALLGILLFLLLVVISSKLPFKKFLDSFKKENGSYICRDLLDCDIRTEEGIKYAIDNNLFKEICPKMVESAVKIAQELIL